MNVSTFKDSLKESDPPETSVYLKALWYDGTGNWKAAHDLIDSMEDKKACWIHAYLHRKEGDIWNADYWYNKAGKKRPVASLNEEWESLVIAFGND